MRYLLDADVFIRAKNLHYGLDFCPAFWDWLIKSNQTGQVFSIEKVKGEIERGNDELTEWSKTQDELFFLKPDSGIFPAMEQVTNWVNDNDYTASAKNTFLQAADYYLIAHALTDDFVVVTHELSANTANKVKIPNVCEGVGLKVMTPYEMLRDEQVRFVLERVT
ncbi:MAG: DUF4411 domain-containing protein [Gammaproteobacteria bacterium]|nr:MAG: DUF4411 domain-containing protein [Gammaproteobacteria bacterium]RTZ75608.1 MAG: DUF4411 domain-containing protein [Gammaproteobacteria bacterium]